MSVDVEELGRLHQTWLNRGVLPHDIEDLFRDIPAVIAALERAERVEAAADQFAADVEYERYWQDMKAAALAPAPEGSDGLQVNAEPLKVVKSWKCPSCGKYIGGLRLHADGCPRIGAPAPGEEGR